MQRRFDDRRGVIDAAGHSTIRLTDEVLRFMDSMGDSEIHFAVAIVKLAVPAYRMGSPKLGARGGWNAPSAKVLSGVVSCAMLSREEEGVLAIGTKSVYILPSERIPIEDIVEFVVHVHCEASFPTVEFRVGNKDGSSDVRHVAFANDYMLRKVVSFLQSACPDARMVFHSNAWLHNKKGVAADGAGVADLFDDEEMHVLSADERMERLKALASTTAVTKLHAYHKQRKQSNGRAVSKVTTFGPGRYTDAADALESDLQRMMREVDKMLHVDDAPQVDVMLTDAPAVAPPSTSAASPVPLPPPTPQKPAASSPSTPAAAIPRRSRSKTVVRNEPPPEARAAAQRLRMAMAGATP